MPEASLSDNRIGVFGLGNIGLPLAIELGKKYATIGFDIDNKRIDELNQGIDTRNHHTKALKIPSKLSFANSILDLHSCNIYIIAVPTAIYPDGTPNILTLIKVSQSIATLLNKGDLIIYESTVFPGCTEDICVPILEQYSKLRYNVDFFVGYSPERINTGDSIHTLTNTTKITAGSNASTAQKVDALYKSIINDSTHLVSSIKIAEAAKLLENAQRDVNIAFMNNVATILSSHNIPFDEVWKASSTKWNFLKFQTGLVGGDCLPIASHFLNYLSDKQENTLSISRKTNEALPQAIVKILMDKLYRTFPKNLNFRVLILGLAYKPNTSNVKGSLVPALAEALKKFQINSDIYDPIAEKSAVMLIKTIANEKQYHLIVKATNHQIFASLDYLSISQSDCLIFDINSFSFAEG